MGVYLVQVAEKIVEPLPQRIARAALQPQPPFTVAAKTF